MQDARYNIKQRESYSKCQIMPRPDYTMCHSMQNASLCNIWNYPKCKLTQGVKVCKVKNYAKCKVNHGTKNANFKYLWKTKVMKGGKLCKIQNKAMCIYMQNAKFTCVPKWSGTHS